MIDRIRAALDRDPAAHGFWGVLEIVLTYAGFHALILHDIAHLLHTTLHIPLIPRLISWFSRFITGIDIHPNAKVGRNVFIDHGMGVVIGETAEVGDGTTIFQGVTLGGTGKQTGKRHPTIGQNVVLGVGSSVLGGLTVGDNSYIGAGAVVLKDVPPNATAVGVPARMVKMAGRRVIGATLDHASLPDPIVERLQALQEELTRTEESIEAEAALPHTMLGVSAPSCRKGRELVERALAARHVSYSVHESDDLVHVTAILCEREYVAVRKGILECDELSVDSEGREDNVGGGEAKTRDDAPCDGGHIIKVVITVTASRPQSHA